MRLLLFFLPVSLALLPASPFDEDLVRNKIFVLAAASYIDDATTCLNNHFENASAPSMVITECDSWDDKCGAYVTVLHEERAIVIAFRGTRGPEQLLLEIEQITVKPLIASPAGGNIGDYFYNSWLTLWTSGIKNAFLEQARAFPDYDLWITGHSLGGSMASITASYISFTGTFPLEKIKLFTFGQPRTGDAAYAAAVDSQVSLIFRVTHLRDIVPHVPPHFLNFAHHREEVFYPNDMDVNDPFQICPGDENDSCSNDYLDESVIDHLWYYGKHFRHYAEADCLETSKNTDRSRDYETAETRFVNDMLKRMAKRPVSRK